MLDKEERIIAVLVGQPDDPQWSDTIDAATGVLQEVEQLGGSMDLFAEKCLHHRRGEFLAIPAMEQQQLCFRRSFVSPIQHMARQSNGKNASI